MMTLSIDELFDVSREENAALLSSCHTQISHPGAAFCGNREPPGRPMPSPLDCGWLLYVLDLFHGRVMF
jgi:hypothetical protein